MGKNEPKPQAITVSEHYVLNVPYSPTKWLEPLARQLSRYRPHTSMWVVQVQGVGYTVEPLPRPTLFGMEDRRPVKVPKTLPQGALIHLEHEEVPRTRVFVPGAEVVRLGLDPERSYFIDGMVCVECRGDEELDWDLAKITEADDFIVPYWWLGPLEMDEHRLQWQMEALVRQANQPPEPPDDPLDLV